MSDPPAPHLHGGPAGTAGAATEDPAGDGRLAELLRGSGLRMTPQREMVLRAVRELGHATPDEVLTRVRRDSEAVNVSTVYRTLEVLEQLGLVRHAHLSDRVPTYHSVGGPEHFHLVCRNCHRVVSVEPDVASGLAARLREEHAFELDLGHLAVFGRCVDCSATVADTDLTED